MWGGGQGSGSPGEKGEGGLQKVGKEEMESGIPTQYFAINKEQRGSS